MQGIYLFVLIMLSGCNDQLPSRPLLEDPSINPAGAITGGASSGGNVAIPTSNDVNFVPPTTVSTLHPRCQSAVRCLYVSTPTYSQGSYELANYVGRRLKISNYQDPGLCVPTSGAMAMKAILNERSSQTRLNNSFLESFPSLQWYEIVYKIGEDSGTDFINGGTWTSEMFYSFQRYFSKTIAKKGLTFHFDGQEMEEHAEITNSQIINSIKAKKFMYVFAADALKIVGPAGWGRYTGHAMLIKGFDGDRLHIQDPWGMDYFARIAPEDLTIAHTTGTTRRQIFQTTGTAGFIGGGKTTNSKIALDEFFGTSLD